MRWKGGGVSAEEVRPGHCRAAGMGTMGATRAVPTEEESEPSAKAPQAAKRHGDAKSAGAAARPMARAAPRESGEDGGRAYTPTMEPSGRAAIPETTAGGAKAPMDREMKPGEIGGPREIFGNMRGDEHGKDGKAD